MKVLFVSPKIICHISAIIWDGLIEILGPDNVIDAVNSPGLHLTKDAASVNSCFLCASRPDALGNILTHQSDFDLLVIINTFLRDYTWDWIDTLRPRLKSGAKVVYINGGDDTYILNPPFPVDAFFQREIATDIFYPFGYRSLLMGFPKRWVYRSPSRPIDVLHVSYFDTHPVRWNSNLPILETKRKILISNCLPFDMWWDLIRKSKLVICPPGAGSDCMRHWEVVAAGGIPIFVGHPPRVREPWFTANEIFTCDSVDELYTTIDSALNSDLETRRERMQSHAVKYHTTEARAKMVLDAVF